MRLILPIFFLSLVFNINAQIDTLRIETKYWDNGVKKSKHYYYQLYAYNFVNWHPNGLKAAEGSYLDDITIKNSWNREGKAMVKDGNGNQRFYYENGKPKSEGEIINGKQSGDWNEYYENGQLKSNGNFGENNSYGLGRKYGLWNYRDENGQQTKTLDFTNNISKYHNHWEDGIQTIKEGNGSINEYFDNGVLMAKGQIKNGYKCGDWNEWYPNGQIRTKVKYTHCNTHYISYTNRDFKFIQSWDSLGNVIGKDSTGWHFIFDENQKLTRKIYHKNGKLDSLYITYFPSGKIEQVDKYRADKWIYRTIYFENGNKAYEFPREKDYTEHGTYKTWFETGEIYKIEEFNNGVHTQETVYFKNGQINYIRSNCHMEQVQDENDSTVFFIVEACDYIEYDKNGGLIKQ